MHSKCKRDLYFLMIYVSIVKKLGFFIILNIIFFIKEVGKYFVYICIFYVRESSFSLFLSILVSMCSTVEIVFLIYFSLIYIPLEFSSFYLIPTLPPFVCLPKIHSFPISFPKSAGLPGIPTEHGLRCYKKPRYIPSYQGWMK